MSAMSIEEIKRTIASLPESDRTMEAFLTFIELNAEDAVDVAVAGSSDPYERAHVCGRAAALRGLLLEIEQMREEFSD